MLLGCISNNDLCINIIVFIHRAQICVQGNYSHVERGINQLLKEICFGDNVQGERMIGFLLLLAYMYNLWSANDFCLISFLQVMQLPLSCVQLKNGYGLKLEPSGWYINVWMLYTFQISILKSLHWHIRFGIKLCLNAQNSCRCRKEFILGTPLYLVK